MLNLTKRMKVALCVDFAGNSVHIRNASVNEIEDAGLAFIEDQSIDFKGWKASELDDSGIIKLSDLDRINGVVLFP